MNETFMKGRICFLRVDFDSLRDSDGISLRFDKLLDYT